MGRSDEPASGRTKLIDPYSSAASAIHVTRCYLQDNAMQVAIEACWSAWGGPGAILPLTPAAIRAKQEASNVQQG